MYCKRRMGVSRHMVSYPLYLFAHKRNHHLLLHIRLPLPSLRIQWDFSDRCHRQSLWW
ncbi:hypothetical protein HanRHA438_Chr13g0615891 [Helianthus annuus]|uniref:Uncharacterized protein n=1 Tax=Helianthus annuus TaxID=4232 RepID=A0A251SW42_HELAN|nr:hypothetical protein HanXRQr2_Chr13g0605461 [Helianthus annuus]KAJ0482769.1 hypothetical protein HanIR_Chr13g0657561 [Helianthus annuus]KAJ0672422.1 hypothetical protein HanOQP8_Chr13g0497131 [Helianthus annuus]KAJ0850672.1 hypothetical protein HanPSC8_Chr13g0583541 [Helianthus annuus]KAJ0859725.1 hypothetical protein HanRHA438_Chr13g0615891 [Helianthus annuus]